MFEPSPFGAPWPYPRWIAHRGAGKLAPENTLAAFRLGAAHGFRAFECDVKLSADGVPFLLHDADLARTTSGSGAAGALDWTVLSQLDAGRWHGPSFAGEPLPTLAAVAAHCLANGFALNLEIKPTPGREAETGRVIAGAAARLWKDAPVPPLLSSFQTQALAAARASAPDLPRALLLDRWPLTGFDVALALDCSAVVMNRTLADAEVIARLHSAGLRALAYTVNDPAEAERLITAGIDGLITDAVDTLGP